MARSTIDPDDDACRAVVERYRLSPEHEAVNFALRSLTAEPLDVEAARQMRRSGWDGDLPLVHVSYT